MIDSIIVPPSIHLMIGTLVLLTNGIVLLVGGWLAVKKRSVNRLASAAFILFQLVLMVQALIGIKLLDQGLGILQLYIHYLGGLAPLFFCLLYYWAPRSKDESKQSQRLVIVAALSLFFTLLTFTVGRSYVADGMDAAMDPAMDPNVTAATENANSLSSGSPEDGASLYITCAGCHGANGVGIEGLGVALTQNEFIRGRSDDELVAYIIEGRSADSPENRSGLAMPAWGGNPSLNEQNLIDIVAYLRTIEGNS